jgi:DNA-binding NarL/FixJ family response regulator
VSPIKRCLVIGHHALLLDGLRSLLEPDFEVLAAPADNYAALAVAAAFRPDIVIVDSDAGEISFLIGSRLREAQTELPVTYLTSGPSRSANTVSKTRPASELLRTIRQSGHAAAKSDAKDNGSSEPALNQVRAATLSERQHAVLALLLRGLSMKGVARELGIAPRTVAFHKYKAMEVNGLKSNSDLISFALRHGLLPFVTAVAG